MNADESAPHDQRFVRLRCARCLSAARRRHSPHSLRSGRSRSAPHSGHRPAARYRRRPRPHVSPQAVTVGRMRRSVSVLCVSLSPPARFAALAVRPVTLGAAHRTQLGGAVALACSAGSGGKGAPSSVADGWINRGGADGGRRQSTSQAHRPGHPAIEPTAAVHARLDGRRIGQFRITVRRRHQPAAGSGP